MFMKLAFTAKWSYILCRNSSYAFNQFKGSIIHSAYQVHTLGKHFYQVKTSV